jgi:hypothetical protein
MAGLSLRYQDDKNLLSLLQSNYDKAEWIYHNYERIINEMDVQIK